MLNKMVDFENEDFKLKGLEDGYWVWFVDKVMMKKIEIIIRVF